MNFLEEKIKEDGIIKEGNILKVDNFLNHQIDVDIIRQIAYEFKRRFRGEQVSKILTIEASGIAIAMLLGDLYDVPVVFAKKGETANCTDDKVLIVDDFLADGQACLALIDIVKQAGGEVVGIGIAIEKGQQKGGQILRESGYHLESIAILESMDYATQDIKFRS